MCLHVIITTQPYIIPEDIKTNTVKSTEELQFTHWALIQYPTLTAAQEKAPYTRETETLGGLELSWLDPSTPAQGLA